MFTAPRDRSSLLMINPAKVPLDDLIKLEGQRPSEKTRNPPPIINATLEGTYISSREEAALLSCL